MGIRGPFTDVINGQYVYRRRIWSTQSRPRKLRLPYVFERRHLQAITGPAIQPWRGWEVAGYFSTNAGARAYSQAYQRFAKNVQDKAELAVALAEKKRSVEMIYKRVGQLIAFTKAIKRGRFGDAAAELGVTLQPKPTRAQEKLWSRRQDELFKWQRHPMKYPPRNERPQPSRVKGAADNWLEFAFGWKPIVTDIYQAVKNLSDGVPPFTVKGRGQDADQYGRTGPGFKEKGAVIWKVQIIADISISDLDAHLLAQLGFTNPLVVLHEVIPWSFLLDWVSNLGQVLSSMSGFPGITISNGAVTNFSEWTTNLEVKSFPWDYTADGRAIFMERAPSRNTIPAPRFIWKPLKFPPMRGASAVALLLQQMKSLSPPKEKRNPRLLPGYYYRG